MQSHEVENPFSGCTRLVAEKFTARRPFPSGWAAIPIAWWRIGGAVSRSTKAVGGNGEPAVSLFAPPN